MAFVNSINYASEEQFMEAVARAKSAREVRETAAAQEALEAASFQNILNNSLNGQNGYVTYANTAAGSNTPVISGSEAMEGYFRKASETYGVSTDLLRAVAKAESNFTSNVVSRSGAVGVMQLMPATAAYLGVTNPYDAEENIMGGAKLLSQLYTKYNGNIELTLAAYNAGSGAVDTYGGVPPYSETQNYVAKIKQELSL